MKKTPGSIGRMLGVSLLSWCLASVGCTSSSQVVRTGGPTPQTVGNGFSPGLSGPGANSADTRGAGGVAVGEGAGIPDGPGTQTNGLGTGAGSVSAGR